MTRAQGWVGIAIVFGTLIAAFYGMNQPFIGTGLSAALASIYAVFFTGFMWWVLSMSGAAVYSGRHPRLFMTTVSVGVFVLGFGAMSVTPGLLYTRLAGATGNWIFTVEASTFVGYQKWGPNYCHSITLLEVSWPVADSELCLRDKLRPGTRLVLPGRRSLMGTWYEGVRLADDAEHTLD